MLEQWLRSVGLADHVDAFLAERVTIPDLPHLTDGDLRELGLSLGERRRFRRAVLDRHPGSVRGETVPAEGRRERLSRIVQGERRPLTVMFVDIVGFTELGEQIADEELLDIVRAFRRLCEAAIARTGGRVAKFLGDGILAYFCYPVAHENDPQRAVRAALEIAATASEIRPLPHRPLAVRIGVATGSLIVGELFEHGETPLSATGSILNLAARLQAVAPPGGVVVGEATHERILHEFDTADLGPHALRGFHTAIRCWRVLGIASARERRPSAGLNLHGRVGEAALIDDLWRAVLAGGSRALLLRGEAGVGKSALVEDFLQRRRPGGGLFSRISGSDLDRDTPFFPVKQFLRSPAGSSREAGGTRDDGVAQALVAKLAGFPFDAACLAGLSAERQRDRTLDAASGLLLGAPRDAPLCLLVEDAHWLDPSTTELLSRLLERMDDAPSFLLITARPGFEAPWPTDARVQEHVLEKLGGAAVRAMAADLLGRAEIPESLLARIVERSDGVPLFIEAVSRQLQQRFDMTGLAPNDAGHEDVPASLHEALMARLDRAGLAKVLAQAASVIGYQLDRALLGSIEDLPPADLDDGLLTLVDRHVLRPDGSAGEAYAFRHALLRDVAYNSLLRDTRRHLHARVAEALEELYPDIARDQPATLALHLAEAGRAADAARCWLEAARRAVGGSALTEATRLLRRGLAAVATLEASPERAGLEVELLGLLGPALMALSGPGAAETYEHYERSYALCQGLPEAPAHFPLYWGWWRVSRDFHTMEARSGWLLGRARTHGDSGMLLQAHHCNWASCYHLGRFERCCEHVEAGLALYADGDWRHHAPLYGNHDARSCAHGELALVRWMQGRQTDAAASHRESLAWSRRLGHLGSLMHSMDCALTYHAMRGSHAEAFAAAEELTVATEEHGFADHGAKGRIYRGWALAMQGDPAAGLRLVREGFARQQDIGTSEDFPIYVCLLAEALLAAGEPERAASELLAARAQFDASGLRIWLPEVLRMTASAIAATRSGAPVLPVLMEAEAVAAEQAVPMLGLRIATDRARLLEAEDDAPGAAGLLERALDALPERQGATHDRALARLQAIRTRLTLKRAG